MSSVAPQVFSFNHGSCGFKAAPCCTLPYHLLHHAIHGNHELLVKILISIYLLYIKLASWDHFLHWILISSYRGIGERKAFITAYEYWLQQYSLQVQLPQIYHFNATSGDKKIPRFLPVFHSFLFNDHLLVPSFDPCCPLPCCTSNI